MTVSLSYEVIRRNHLTSSLLNKLLKLSLGLLSLAWALSVLNLLIKALKLKSLLKFSSREAVSSRFIDGLSSRFIDGLSSRFIDGIPSHFIDGLSSRFIDGLPSRFIDGLPSRFIDGLPSRFIEGERLPSCLTTSTGRPSRGEGERLPSSI